MKRINLVLSGGGVKGYAHLGVWKYLYEQAYDIQEIVAVSSGALVAPFIYQKKRPSKVIDLFLDERPDKKLFPKWFIPDRFELFAGAPDTFKLGRWIQKQFSPKEVLSFTSLERRIHIMAAKNPVHGERFEPVDMLSFTNLAHAFAASSAISGVFKTHKVMGREYIDGGHWNNVPMYYDFKDKTLPVVVVNLGYSGKAKKPRGRLSKLAYGLEAMSYARVIEDISKWYKVNTNPIKLISPKLFKWSSLDFNLDKKDIHAMIEAGYQAAHKSLHKSSSS